MAAPHPAMSRDTAGGECDTRFVVADVFQPLRHYVPPPLYLALPNTGEEFRFPITMKTEIPRNATGHSKGGV